MSLKKMEEGVAYAKARKRVYQTTHPQLRQDHLRDRLLKAEADKNEKAVREIKQKIEQEGGKKMWYMINRSQQDPHTWQQQGDQLIIMMDANEHVLTGSFTSKLKEIGLLEISHRCWGDEEPNTFTGGSKPIDGVWASVELEIGGFKLLPFSESVGNHCTMIFDVSTRSLIGEFEHRVVRAACRCLNTKTASLSRYNAVLERLMTLHKMDKRLNAIIDVIVDDKPTTAQKEKMDRLDNQFVELQTHAE